MLVPKEGVEPTRAFAQRFLRPSRLPFRHFGMVALQEARTFAQLHSTENVIAFAYCSSALCRLRLLLMVWMASIDFVTLPRRHQLHSWIPACAGMTGLARRLDKEILPLVVR